MWEPAVAGALRDPAFVDPRRKLDLLADDISRLSEGTPRLDGLPCPREPFAFATAAEALGSMYVVEGSMLGGKLIARHVVTTIGHVPAYHDAYGARTGAMWRAFQARLAGDLAAPQAEAAIAAARLTFLRLRQWIG